ncbi:Multi antimicrobial extrusion protein (Na(+)/drug antiporter), MATE family of MDR efflux pump [Lachnospiraceae bacterium TWA4]|nr:Multi antimicrobial extrusion protein (Na(+)/drug antiporter), MATE family of MDR efflux pump [Lachnospiraceae bacterium TWA4]
MGTAPVGSLLRQFAIPSIIAMLVSSLYNIVDQIFIGHSVGMLGNAATNVAFPLSNTCTALSLLFGIGGAACFNLAMGAGDKDEAGSYIANAASMLVISGLCLCVIVQIFLQPLLLAFGSTKDVLPYAMTYTRITSMGFPFLILSIGGGHLIRADGSPRFSMTCNLVGAITNTILDAIFILGLDMGMAGAALATILGQILSSCLVINYLRQYKTVNLTLKMFILTPKVLKVISLGMTPFFNQLAMMVVQIALNNSMTFYGAASNYGSEIPLACSGIVSKVNMVLFSIIIGISQGLQPIASFNYGAKNYSRVKEVSLLAIKAGMVVSIFSFILFQVFPRQIIGLFGGGSELYYQFAIRYFRIYLFFSCVNCLQPISSNFFTAIGKPLKGTFLALTRQALFYYL